MNRYLMAPSGGLATASHLHPQPLGAQFFPNWASRPARGSSPTTRRRARIADSRCRNENAPEPKTAPTASNTNAPSTTPDTPPTHHPSRCDGEPVGEAGRVVWGRILTRYGGRPGLRRTGGWRSWRRSIADTTSRLLCQDGPVREKVRKNSVTGPRSTTLRFSIGAVQEPFSNHPAPHQSLQYGSAVMALPAPDTHDIDHLLARYRTARAQQALFDVRGERAGTGYDEFVDAAGNGRPTWRELAECVGDRGRGGLDQLRSIVRGLIDNDGITYIQVDRHGDAVTNGDGTAEPGPWHLDALPLVLSASDWDILESGLVQRSRLLDAVLTDLYGPRLCVTSGVLPPQLLFAHPGYVRAARGIDVPGRHQLFLHGCDISRAADGSFRVNADWTQAPSGAGYELADRRVVAHAIPDLYERIGPRPASPWAQALRLALIDAAPESAEEAVVVVLSPGINSETSFDQAYLASVLGFPLVESADLVVRDGKLWMRSMGTLKRVDVVLRRVDAEYADPLDLRADSRLGVVGMVEVLRRGAVTVVNTLGSGILESPGLLRFLPELAERLLGETPLLRTAPLYWGGINTERSHLLTNLSSLLIRPVTGREAIVGPALSSEQLMTLGVRIEATPWQWVGQELPLFASAPTDYYPGGLSAAHVG